MNFLTWALKWSLYYITGGAAKEPPEVERTPLNHKQAPRKKWPRATQTERPGGIWATKLWKLSHVDNTGNVF